MEQDTALHGTPGPAGRATPVRIRLRDCLVEADLNRITAPHGETALEPKAMAVLVHLIEHAGAVVSAGELIDAVWRGRPMGDNPVYRCIAQLRRALGDDPREPTYIATVPTKGYRLIAPVETPGPPQEPPQPAVSDRPGEPLHEESTPAARPSRRRVRAGALALSLCLVVLAAWLLPRFPHAPSAPASTEAVTIAVLPLQTAARDDTGLALAQSVTDVIHQGLARLPGLIVVADTSAANLPGATMDARAVGRSLHARYLLRGKLAAVGRRLQVDVQLVDGRSGKPLWSAALDRSVDEVASVRDEIARHVAGTLQLPPPAHVSGEGAIHLDAYAVYLRGQRLLVRGAPSGADEALELFRRATILDPGFARAYLGLGLALVQKAEAGQGPAAGERADAAKAFDRALLLDPAMGEAWVGRALLAQDPAQAEALFRKGLALAPSDGPGHVRHAQFLFANARVGEAIDAMERARRIDPLAPELCLTQAFFVMVVRSDVAEHDRLVGQALEINPRLPTALYQLAYSKWEYSGEFAQAAQLIERAIAVEPQSLRARMLARDIYLDLGDPGAATAALGTGATPLATLEIAQYQGDRRRAATALAQLAPAAWPDGGPQAAKAQAARDAAIEAGDPAAAVRVLQPVHAARAEGLPMWSRGFALAYAHTLTLAGDTRGGQALARETLALVDAHGIGRTPHWFSRERAAAFAVLGDDAQVLRELAHSVENGQLYRWWYLAGHDPLYAHLRGDPRFQALNRLAMARIDHQRTLFEAMRREGGFPVAGLAR